MWRIGLAAAAVALSGPAWGQAGLDPVLERLAAQGYGGFEVEREGGTVKVEALRDGVQRELVYEAGTGRLVEDSTRPFGKAGTATDDHGGRVDRDDRTEPGDDRDARGASSNERDDDSRGRGSDDDDDGDDDHGGRGGDDSGDDDSGDDDNGRDDDSGHHHDSSGRGGDDDSGGRGGRGGDDD